MYQTGQSMKIEDVKDEILSKSPLDLTQLFSREELIELRDQLKAKRASLIESRDKCSNGNSIALFNLHLGECKALSSRINQSITMLDMNKKMLKKEKTVDQQLAVRFFSIAKENLDPNLFNQLKEKALSV